MLNSSITDRAYTGKEFNAIWIRSGKSNLYCITNKDDVCMCISDRFCFRYKKGLNIDPGNCSKGEMSSFC